MSQEYLPETRPCPECGGQRVAYKDVGLEIAVYGTEAAKSWNAVTRNGKNSHTLVRCTNCGYTAFFQGAPPQQP